MQALPLPPPFSANGIFRTLKYLWLCIYFYLKLCFVLFESATKAVINFSICLRNERIFFYLQFPKKIYCLISCFKLNFLLISRDKNKSLKWDVFVLCGKWELKLKRSETGSCSWEAVLVGWYHTKKRVGGRFHGYNFILYWAPLMDSLWSHLVSSYWSSWLR